MALTFLAAWNYGRAGTLKGVKETWLRTCVPVKALIWWGTYPFISEKTGTFSKSRHDFWDGRFISLKPWICLFGENMNGESKVLIGRDATSARQSRCDQL